VLNPSFEDTHKAQILKFKVWNEAEAYIIFNIANGQDQGQKMLHQKQRNAKNAICLPR
jgi:hypothetical protein